MMATTSFPRSRSPVISIRTQPEDEDTLRAEIKAATRTQHEILPRYSWHSALSKRETSLTSGTSHLPYRTLRHRDLPPSQLARSRLSDGQSNVDEYSAAYVDVSDDSNVRAAQPKKSWRRLKKRSENPNNVQPTLVNPLATMEAEQIPQRRHKSIWKSKPNKTIVTEKDREAQHAQFNAWLVEKFEERLEEQDALPDIREASATKQKRAIRRSVYGSLSNTKSFFRRASKHQLEKACSSAPMNVLVAPHVYDFETKDQLRDYLGDASAPFPLSPTENAFRVDEMANDGEPVELSAGPLPAELEATLPNESIQSQVALSRTSTPSVRDLPPYPDEKKFQVDIAKTAIFQSNQSEVFLQEQDRSSRRTYLCGCCEKQVLDHQVYDFCTPCERVICVICAEKTPACTHEAKAMCVDTQTRHATSNQPVHQPTAIKRKKVGDFNTAHQRLHGHGLDSDETDLSHASTYLVVEHTPQRTFVFNNGSPNSDPTNNTDANANQSDLLKEFGLLKREQELGDRERELTFRARELEIREREVIVQQKNDLLIHKLETLVSFQELAKHAFIGAQFQPHDCGDSSNPPTKTPSQRSTTSAKEKPIVLESFDGNDKDQKTERAGVFQAVVDAENSINGITDTEVYIKSNVAQKRKKESGNDSSSSTPPAASSPAQARKTPSRGNSERSTGQDDEDDEEGQRSPKKNKAEPTSPNGRQVLFACPYSKHDRERFSSRNMVEKNYRGCDGHFLTDVSRLKQHLKRVHRQPETYCPRCYEEFDSSSKLTQHAMADIACAKRECPFPEKMNKTQQDQIHTKRPRVDPATVWYDIYKVLFPGSPLPDSPYVEKEERLLTPISATPLIATNDQAAQHLSRIFNDRLNQYEIPRDPQSRHFINQALTESFAELLNTFSLSPAPSPGAGPSIVVSPVSSLGTTRTMLDSPLASTSRPPQPERKRSVTDVISQQQQVPILQQPRPPRLHLNTALQVPTDHHRSLSTQGKHETPTSMSPPEAVIFDVDILPHIQDDKGYDDECPSFKEGDDQIAMAWIPEQAPPSSRNKSVMSIDSGYGSGRSQYQVNAETSKNVQSAPSSSNGINQYHTERQPTHSKQYHSVQSISHNTFATYYPDYSSSSHEEHAMPAFSSYLFDLDPEFQECDAQGIDYSLVDASGQWSIP